MSTRTGAAKLVKLRDFDVRELQRKLGDLEGRRIATEQAMADLAARVKAETEASAVSLEASVALPAFLEKAALRRAAFEDILYELKHEIAKTREDLNVAFAELKKVEIVVANRQAREAAHVNKVEQAELDEVGVERARRQASADAAAITDDAVSWTGGVDKA